MKKSTQLFCTKNLGRMGILSAMAFVLMRVLEIPLPIFPSFLKIDFGDVPAIIATLVIHPFAGIIVVAVKNLLALMNSSSGGVGEIANVVVGVAFIFPIAILVKKKYRLRNVVIGCLMGTILMMLGGMITNAFITMPLYGEEACIGLGSSVNPAVIDKWTFLLYVIAPFNLLKGFLVSAISIITVKSMNPVIKQLSIKKA